MHTYTHEHTHTTRQSSSTGDVDLKWESKPKLPIKTRPWWGRFLPALPSIGKDGGKSWRQLLPWVAKGEGKERVVFREEEEEEWEDGGEGGGDGGGWLVVRVMYICVWRWRRSKARTTWMEISIPVYTTTRVTF